MLFSDCAKAAIVIKNLQSKAQVCECVWMCVLFKYL